jgi:hypothetical protein
MSITPPFVAGTLRPSRNADLLAGKIRSAFDHFPVRLEDRRVLVRVPVVLLRDLGERVALLMM